MNTCKRIIALFASFAICLSLFVVPAYAVPALPASGGSVSVGYADFLLQYMFDHADEAVNGAINKISSIFDSDVCTSGKAENGRHNFVRQMTEVDGQTGEYYVCEYCGKSGGEVFSSAYDSYVDDMPVNGIDSNGGFVWYPTASDLTPAYDEQVMMIRLFGGAVYPKEQWLTLPCDVSANNWYGVLSDNKDGLGLDAYPKEGKSYLSGSSSGSPNIALDFAFTAPVAGVFVRRSSIAVDASLTTENLGYVEVSRSFVPETKSYMQADKITLPFTALTTATDNKDNYIAAHVKYFFPVFDVVPDSGAITDDTMYSPDTRPGTITGKYLVQNGDAYEDSSTTIINEDDNSIYNPVTNTTTNYDSWSYDYSTRTYTMTDNTNNSVSTVTYGDENITINEGGNTYNVYYGTVINNNGGDDSGNGGNNGGGSDIDFPSNTGIDTLGERLKVYFQRLPEMMGDINNFLSDAFPYIPQDLMYLIEFSLTISLFMAIIKMIRR